MSSGVAAWIKLVGRHFTGRTAVHNMLQSKQGWDTQK
jgi:hypothetical protein